MTGDGGSGGVGGSADARRDDATADAESDHDAGQSHAAGGVGVDWRGWLLVAVVVVSLVVIPAVIVLRPPTLPFEAAFLALPMVPAVLLGATAVWVAVRSRVG